MNINLLEALTLFALNSEKGKFYNNLAYYTYSLIGAVFLELAIQKRIALDNKKVRVLNSERTGDAIFDDVLEKIQKSKREKSIKHWIMKLHQYSSSKIKKQTLKALVRKNILREEEKVILGIFKQKRYFLKKNSIKDNLKKRLDKLLTYSSKGDGNDLMLLSLVHTAQLTKIVFGKEKAKTYQNKIEKLTSEENVSNTLSKTIDAIQEEILAATTVAILAAATTITTTSVATNS